MKKLFLSIVALCATISVCSQSVKSIRINGQDQKQKYISISDIDSITYDVENQCQVVWANGMDRKFQLSEIESVSFESFDTKYSYFENIDEGLDAIYTKDGYVAIFGIKNIPDLSNNNEEERILYISKVDEEGNVDESDATTVIVDSTYFPVRIVGNEMNVVLSKKDDNHFDCLFYNQNTDEWEESKNLEILSILTNSQSASRPMRAMATGGSTNFNLTNAITALSALRNVSGTITAEGIGKVAPGVGLFGDAASAGGLDEVGLSIGVTVAGNWVGALIAAAGYISSEYDKLKQRVFGKDIKISIEDIKQTNRKSFTVSYSVDGLNERGLTHSGLFFSLLNYNKMQRSVIILPTKNGYDEKHFTDMNAGSYEIDMTLISKEYPFLRYVTKPTIEFAIFDLGLDRYEIEDNPSYSNGTVNFNMNVFLKGSDEGLGDIQQFGYYTRYSNSIPDYKQVSYLSTIFESTPLTYELPIEREGFFEENRNYNTFEAKATGYYIGAYVVLKNGNIVTIDEQEIEGLIYKQKPSITFTSVSVNSTEVTSYDEENDVTRYKTQYSFDCDIKGTFWFNTIQFQIYSDHWNNNWSNQTVSDDGSYTMNGNMTYGSNSSMNHTGFYQMYLHNGGTKSSSNSLIFGGVPGNPSISIGGTPAYAPARKVAKKDVTSNNEASSTFVSMKKR